LEGEETSFDWRFFVTFSPQNQLDNADPFDIESQRKIEEMIRQEQIQENMEVDIEHGLSLKHN